MSKYKTISEFALLLNGYAFKSKQYADEGTRIIRIANVQEGYITDENPCFYPMASMQGLEKYTLCENDLLISLTGNVGRVGILPKSMLPAALNQRVSCIRLKNLEVDTKYLFYYLSRKEFVKDCVNASRGVAQLNLSTKWLEQYPVPVLNIKEQHRIVTRIEELFSELDKGAETLQTIKQQLAVYRQAVLKAAFEGINSTKYMVKDVCKDIKVGIVIKPSQYYTDAQQGIKAFRSANVKEFHINNSDWVYLSQAGYSINSRSVVHTDDILIVRSGYPGTSCVVTEQFDGCNAIDILIAVPNKEIVLPQFLCAYTNSPFGKAFVSEKKRGVAQKHFNVSGYSKMMIPVPDLNKQREIVQEVESRLSVCDSIEQTVDTALAQADAMRQSILKKAFEGGFSE